MSQQVRSKVFVGDMDDRDPPLGRQVQDQHILSHVLLHFRQHIDARQVTHDP